MKRLSLVSRSPEETESLGEMLGRLAQPGDLYLLIGELGAGKTSLVQGLARGLGTREPAKSPSFTLINEYHGRLPLYHVDLYRLDKVEDMMALGLDDYIFFGQGVTAVEWADRAGENWPEDRLSLSLAYVGEEERRITFEAEGARHERLLIELEDMIGEPEK